MFSGIIFHSSLAVVFKGWMFAGRLALICFLQNSPQIFNRNKVLVIDWAPSKHQILYP